MNIPLAVIREKVFINKAWFALVVLFACVNIAFLVERYLIISQPPVVYEYIKFLDSKKYKTLRLQTQLLNNESLIKSLAFQYVLGREKYPSQEINIIKSMSSNKVWNAFSDFRKKMKSRIENQFFKRLIEIKMYQKLSHDIRQLEIETIDFINNQKITKNFKVNLRFEFVDELVRADRVAVNPSGFKVVDYSIKRL